MASLSRVANSDIVECGGVNCISARAVSQSVDLRCCGFWERRIEGFVCGVQIVDRSKDVLKSGGEWISSIEVRAALRGIFGHCDGSAKLPMLGTQASGYGEVNDCSD